MFAEDFLVSQHWLRDLSGEQARSLLAEFNHGARGVCAIMTAKLSHFETLPWLLAGLTHVDPQKARCAAAACLAKYGEAMHEQQQLDLDAVIKARHHPLTEQCLKQGSIVRADIGRFAVGEIELKDMTAQSLELLPLRFCPCAERVIESKHAGIKSSLKLGARKRTSSATSVSLYSGRLHEFEARMRGEPGLIKSFLDAVERVRSPKEQAAVFQILEHPSLRPLLEQRGHPTKLEPIIREIIYHLDPLQQYVSLASVEGAVSSRAKALVAAKQQLKRKQGQAHRALGDLEGRRCNHGGPLYWSTCRLDVKKRVWGFDSRCQPLQHAS